MTTQRTTVSISSDLLLLMVTMLWGAAFVAQQRGMDRLGPFGFNACRFLLGAALVWLFCRLAPARLFDSFTPRDPTISRRDSLQIGSLLFLGATFQQSGLAYTTAGKAGFLTVLYAVFVPLLSRLSGDPVHRSEIAGSLLAFAGSYFLCTTGTIEIEWGDFLVMLGSLAWALHALAISRAVARHNPLTLAWQQFLVCGTLSAALALLLEPVSAQRIGDVAYPILYAGGASIALGYTLQVVVQRNVSPSHAVIIFSLEGVFAALAGWALLGEDMGLRGMAGASLMLVGVLLAQLGRTELPAR